jgi:NDP-sugar pyrophosphorylase family protein
MTAAPPPAPTAAVPPPGPTAAMPPLALLAGGLATRMRPLTDTIPKALIEVAGEPFVFHQLRLLRREGIERVVICAGHLGERVQQAVGDGARFGLAVEYEFDGPRLLGTGGALRRALPRLGRSFWVMYGDSYLDIAFAPVLRAFLDRGPPALMTLLRNDGSWDSSNVVFTEGRVDLYDKTRKAPRMRHIDFGLSLLRADAIASRPIGEAFDLADIFHELSLAGRLAGHEVDVRFYEIGSFAGLRDTTEYLLGQAGGQQGSGRPP